MTILSAPRETPAAGERPHGYPWSWILRSRRRLRLLPAPVVDPADPLRDRGPLLGYLDELESWSHRTWAAAGVRRHWLPGAIGFELAHQWWTQTPPPEAPELRRRVARFWTEVTPWLAWNPGTEPLPDPPADPELLAGIVSALHEELNRSGRPVVGGERSAALRAAIRRVERQRGLHGAAGALRVP